MNKQASPAITRLSGASKLTLLFALEVGFVVAFHLLGNVQNMGIDFSNFSQWMDVTPPEVALVASIRILALIFSYWLLGTSLIYMIARALNLRGVIRGLEFITIPGVRRVIDAGVAATIIGGTVLGGASAVFAQSSHQAQKQSAPAAVTTTYKDLRVLYNPGDTVAPAESVEVAVESPEVENVAVPEPEVVVQSPGEDPIVEESTQVNKVVLATTEKAPAPPSLTPKLEMLPVVTTTTPAPAPAVAPTPTPTPAPTRDADAIDGPTIGAQGNYIPDPAGGSTPAEVPATTPTTTTPKVVVTSPTETVPTPSAPVVTTPKVTVPTTTKPVTTPTVDVKGKQVEKPGETPAPTAPTAASTTYTVVAGDNFWNIAKAHVEESLGHEPNNTEVANYWVKLIEANKSTLRSGDPDLIFPGEVFTFPAV